MVELLRRVAERGDAEAFGELYLSFGPRVKAYMIRQGADAGTAEELAQETMLTVWRKASLYVHGKGSPSTWIFTIARNLRIDRLRREVAWQELPQGHREIASDEMPPDEAASIDQRKLTVQTALNGLPEDQEKILSMAYMDGLSQSEIAAKLKIPLGTVKSRMRLAYQKVRAELDDLAPEAAADDD